MCDLSANPCFRLGRHEGVMTYNIDRDIKEKLAKNHACYVLITCDSPKKDGKMNVEMSYEGDPVLAAYLLQGAQTYLEELHIAENDSLN